MRHPTLDDGGLSEGLGEAHRVRSTAPRGAGRTRALERLLPRSSRAPHPVCQGASP